MASSNSTVPTAPGVYTTGHSDTPHDPEISRTYVHVGKTGDLQRWLNEHLPGDEKNPGLREYIENNHDGAICWFARVDAADAGAVQDDIIYRLRPRFNTAGNPPTNHEDHT